MLGITDYVEEIYKDFSVYANEENYLCKLKELNFQAGSIPNYEDKEIQQFYLLRYAFAYAFEYSNMYDDILSKLENINQIEVTSIGCGAMIDYWSLIKSIKERKLDYIKITYTGIDEIDWDYKFEKRKIDNVDFRKENIVDYMNSQAFFDSDIYFFPKSISEFDCDEMKAICDNFKNKKIIKDKIYFAISLRNDQWSMDRDMSKTKSIIDALRENGFEAGTLYDEYIHFKEDKGIAAYDNEFKYPDYALDYIKTLNTHCKQFYEIGENCNIDCEPKLNRWPTLKTGKICYQVIEFERM